MQKVLDSLLAAALAQPVHLSANVLDEANENLFYLGLTEAELSLCTAPAIEAWLEAVVAGKRQQLQQPGDHYARQFYCWHDALAAHLRFSLVSAAAALPFGCRLRLVERSVVVQEFLTQEYLVFDENIFEPDSAAGRLAAEPAAAEAYVLSVWRTLLP